MDQFLKFTEDKKFIRWVLLPDEELNQYWRTYQELNPDDAQPIETARRLVAQLRSKKEEINAETVLSLYTEILSKTTTRKKSFYLSFRGFMRYAAVATIFFATGIFSYYLIDQKSPGLVILSNTEIASLDDARLILSGGKNIPLTEKESVIEYKSGGNIVINNRDTVKAEVKQTAQEINQLVVPYGKNSFVTLADGTQVYLNAGSRLIYPSYFEGKVREVILFGEAYFNVAPMTDKPFIVQTSEINVEVLGTQFNLSAYASDKTIETVLVEGKVKITENNRKLFKKGYVLNPNELASFNRETLETTIRTVDVSNYVTWHEGYMNFESVDLSRIVKRIERYYNINVRLDDPMLGQLKITGKLKLKEEKDNLLQVIASAASLDLIKINDNYYVLK